MPPGSQNPTLVTFGKLVERDINALTKKSGKHNTKWNLTKVERKALDELKDNTDIVVKSADKGGAIIVQNAKDYAAEALRQLNNDYFYQHLSRNPLDEFIKERDMLLDNAIENKWLSKNQYEFLRVLHPVTPVFYLLPKVHKRLQNPPGRPIVASKNSLTEPLSQFVDVVIKDIVKTLPSYISDTRDVLKLLSNITIPDNVYLVTFDVESLYTNIPHEGGLEAMAHYLESQDDGLPTELLLNMTRFILKSNYFLFNNKYFLQVQGTSMGSPFAPNYANLFMGLWEEKHIFNNNPFKDNLLIFKRFIDDILLVFTGSEHDLSLFNKYINDTHPNLKFTMEYSSTKIHFLDLEITLHNNMLETSIYRKETDRNTILHASSFHPDHIVKNIPYGQFVRLKRICSNDEDFEVKANDMAKRFRDRGYDETVIDQARGRASHKNRSELLNPAPKTSDSVVTFVKRIINKHWKLLKCDPSLNHLPDKPRFCFKRGKNIKDLVVSSMYQEVPTPSTTSWLSKPLFGNYRCGKCAHCSNTVDTKTFTHPHTGEKYNIKQFINCVSTHVVYMLKCPCGLMYIGQTKRNLKLRIAEHKASIRNGNMEYAIARHYKDRNHGSATTLRFVGIERVMPNPRGGDLIKQLLKREAHWIHKLNTVEPHGLNEKQELSVFL
ncbi:uncharacterized protein LOC134467623 [Engraulis encrasicolus]|uniref:uncharacterized protein LOC134467623 n=1 Tax=Engraulis encrasicolus TaxID=184585 RepID=UPI002FD643CD